MTPNSDPGASIVAQFPFAVNPHLSEVRPHLNDWARDTRAITDQTAWRRFEAADFGWFAAVVHPTAGLETVKLIADWFGWLFLVDDQLDDGALGRDARGAGDLIAQLIAVLESDGDGVAAEDAERAPVVRSLAGLWRRTAPHGSATWRRRFTAHLEKCLVTAATWELANRVGGLLPDEETYIEQRRRTGAIYVCMDLIEIAAQISAPTGSMTIPISRPPWTLPATSCAGRTTSSRCGRSARWERCTISSIWRAGIAV